MNAICKEAGTLMLDTVSFVDNEGNDRSNAHAAYQFLTPEKLYNVAKHYDVVVRPNGDKRFGKNYTIEHARQDMTNAKNANQHGSFEFAI